MYIQASMELGPEDVSLLERCPHFRGCYVQASTAIRDVSIAHFTFSRGVHNILSHNLSSLVMEEMMTLPPSGTGRP